MLRGSGEQDDRPSQETVKSSSEARVEPSRRHFLEVLGSGMFLTSLGVGLTQELGLAQTPLAKLQPRIVAEIDGGASLAQLIAAGALANARAFGGRDYEGYHAFMALMPAYEMSTTMTGRGAARPVLKVLYRNTARMQAMGADHEPAMRGKPRSTSASGPDEQSSESLMLRVRSRDMQGAEAAFDALLRQSIRQCVDREGSVRSISEQPIRRELPSALEESGVLRAPLGRRAVDDDWIQARAHELRRANPKEGARLVAAALREGIAPEALGEALSLASTQRMLRQRGRNSASPGKPVGSVHGAGTGVHSSDTAAAWRGMARFGSEYQRKLALVAGGYHVAGQGAQVAAEPFGYEGVEVEARTEQASLGMLAECLRSQDQAGAARAASLYAELGAALEPILALLHDSSLASDGALHAEKYYRTQAEALEGDRPAFRPLHLAALARVCASQSFASGAGRGQALALLA
jgi:hypothetical protein